MSNQQSHHYLISFMDRSLILNNFIIIISPSSKGRLVLYNSSTDNIIITLNLTNFKKTNFNHKTICSGNMTPVVYTI